MLSHRFQIMIVQLVYQAGFHLNGRILLTLLHVMHYLISAFREMLLKISLFKFETDFSESLLF